MNQKENTQRGFITTIILIIVALVALKYAFHFDIIQYWQSAQVQGWVTYGLTLFGKLRDWIMSLINHFSSNK